jgi:hypothetical protein
VAGLLARSNRNARIDGFRQRASRPLTVAISKEKAVERGPGAGVALAAAEQIEVMLPIDMRIIEKAHCGLPLTPEELDRAAQRNLKKQARTLTPEVLTPEALTPEALTPEALTPEALTPEALRQEKERIIAWLEAHPEREKKDLSRCFLWFSDTHHATATRIFRLRLAAAVGSVLIQLVASRARVAAAQPVWAGIKALIEFVRTGTWDDADRCPVQVFAETEDTAARLWDDLASAHLGGQALEAVEEARAGVEVVLADFPVLRKLASCWRHGAALSADLAGTVPGAVQKLMTWLKEGRWRTQFCSADRTDAQAHRRQLAGLRGPFNLAERARLDLVLLWLDTCRESGAAPGRLQRTDRVWRLSHSGKAGWPVALPGLANELVAAERNGRVRTPAVSAAMRELVRELPAPLGSAVRDLQDCLVALDRGVER